MKRFRKKPVVIEALQWLGTNWDEVCEFLDVPKNGRGVPESGDQMLIKIDTLEGSMYARIGDWIIKGVKGEFYPIKADIFEQTYEPEESR